MAYVLVVLSSSIEQHHFELFSSTLFSRVARRPAQGGGESPGHQRGITLSSQWSVEMKCDLRRVNGLALSAAAPPNIFQTNAHAAGKTHSFPHGVGPHTCHYSAVSRFHEARPWPNESPTSWLSFGYGLAFWDFNTVTLSL